MARSESDHTSALSCQISPALVVAWALHVLAGESWASQAGIYESHHVLHGELPTFPGWLCAVLLWAAPSPLPQRFPGGNLCAGRASPQLAASVGHVPSRDRRLVWVPSSWQGMKLVFAPLPSIWEESKLSISISVSWTCRCKPPVKGIRNKTWWWWQL